MHFTKKKIYIIKMFKLFFQLQKKKSIKTLRASKSVVTYIRAPVGEREKEKLSVLREGALSANWISPKGFQHESDDYEERSRACYGAKASRYRRRRTGKALLYTHTRCPARNIYIHTYLTRRATFISYIILLPLVSSLFFSLPGLATFASLLYIFASKCAYI